MKNENEDEIRSKRIEVIIGDSSELNFSEVGDYMNDLKPKDIKGSIKDVIIPKNTKSLPKKKKKPTKKTKTVKKKDESK